MSLELLVLLAFTFGFVTGVFMPRDPPRRK